MHNRLFYHFLILPFMILVSFSNLLNAASNDPLWSDSQGWNDVSNYSTIQAVGVGDELYLLARGNAGMITLRYGRDSYKWVKAAENDPTWSDSYGWKDVSNYSMIQAVGVGDDLYLLTRADAGMTMLRYDRDTNSWVSIVTDDPPWSDSYGWNDASNYSTIQAVGVGDDLYLLARADAGMITLRYDSASGSWTNIEADDPAWSDSEGWNDVSNYSTIQAVVVGSDLYLLARGNAGMVTLRYDDASGSWVDVATNDPAWSDFHDWQDVSNYSTIQAVGVGDDLYLLARGNEGMTTLQYDRVSDSWVNVAKNDPEWSDARGWSDISNYSTIQAVAVGDDLYLLARADAGITILRYDGASDSWVDVTTDDPAWSDPHGWEDVSNYSTIQAVGAGDDLYLFARGNAGMITRYFERP